MNKILFFSALLTLSLSCGNKTAVVVNNTSTTSVKTDEEALLDKVQRQTFDYYWEGGEPISGAARARIHMDNIYPHNDQDVVTSGGTGFGVMSVIVDMEKPNPTDLLMMGETW